MRKTPAELEEHIPKGLYTTGDILQITISPSFEPKEYRQHFIDMFESFKATWYAFLLKHLEKITEDYEFNIEVSRTGRFHLHGWVKVKDPFKLSFALGRIKYSNNYNIDVDIDNIEPKKLNQKWKEYCKKDEKQWFQFQYNPIIRPDGLTYIPEDYIIDKDGKYKLKI